MAIGPGGKETGLRYKDYTDESKRFMRALMQVYLEGDGSGRPFFFPKPDCHITAADVDDDEYLNLLGEVSSVRGNPYYVFDRGSDPSVSQCCRLKIALSKTDVDELATPWRGRFSALQNVTMNLPGMAMATRDETHFLELLRNNMDVAREAHQNKFDFFDKLMSLGESGPLSLLNMKADGLPYVRYDKMKFLIGMVGLNEAVEVLCGEQLHESKNALMLGMRIIAEMNKNCKDVTNDLGFTTILEQTPAESTAFRFARLDRERFGTGIDKYLKGDFSTGGIYYTNSTYINVNSNMSAIERIKQEGKFHQLIDAGALTHVWLGEKRPPAENIAAVVRKTFYNSQNSQITFSPEFTSCNNCHATTRGLVTPCPKCGSENVDGITRVTGYLSRTSLWNKGKIAELHDRHRVHLQ
jgi:ribonucleoside-triphosphate reductase